MLDQIKLSLDSNSNLTDEMRDMIYGLTVIFHKKFPEIRLKNLSEKLKTLKIEKISRYVQKHVIKYTPSTNTITFNLTELDKEHDVKHLFMFALLQVMTSNGSNTGFDIDRKFEALNSGYTEILACNLVGNESDYAYYAEQASFANVIGVIVGSDVIKNAYFYNKPNAIINALEEAGVDI